MDEANIQQEINKYKKFKKVDGATYRKVNFFLRKRTYITAREWALARLCTDFRTSGGAEMTFIGQHLPELVPFMEDTYSPQAVNQARHSFKKKVRKSGATFFYGAMCGFFSTDELDDLLFEASEVSRFLLEVEGTTIDIDDEIDIEDRITKVMRSVGETAKTLLKARSSDNDAEEPREIALPSQPTSPNPHKSQKVRSPRKAADPLPITPVAGQSPDNKTPLPSPDQKATGGTEPVPKNTPVDLLPIAEPVTPTSDSTGSHDPLTVAGPPENINTTSTGQDPPITPTSTKETLP
ncbi:MAG: DUF5806 family protein [Methanoregula sp.]|nr:DUF5806 family protein [Methanoregula sp.]